MEAGLGRNQSNAITPTKKFGLALLLQRTNVLNSILRRETRVNRQKIPWSLTSRGPVSSSETPIPSSRCSPIGSGRTIKKGTSKRSEFNHIKSRDIFANSYKLKPQQDARSRSAINFANIGIMFSPIGPKKDRLPL